MRKDGGFKEEGNWYKGNLHSHTVDSDGCLTPGEAVELFAEHGYSFLGISDHDIDVAVLSGILKLHSSSQRSYIMSYMKASGWTVAG